MITFELQSQFTKYNYTIRVREPNCSGADQPVFFILDGSWYFPYIQTMVERQSPNARKTHIADAWVISIEHGEDNRNRRFYDFTPFAESYDYPERFKEQPIRDHGGAKNFHSFLKNELFPTLSRYKVPEQKRHIFGHSLAGLYVCYEALQADCLFDYGIAFSPSLWWNKKQIFKLQQQLINQMPLYMAVGSAEGFMVPDAKQYSHLLPNATLYIAEAENHASIVPAVMSRAFRHFYEK